MITGATGFLGSVLVEKLLRCFGIKKMFLLIRSKNNESAKERIEKFSKQNVSRRRLEDIELTPSKIAFSCQCYQIFDAVREKDPRFSEKLVPVEVDYAIHDLNISAPQLKIIQDEVQVKIKLKGIQKQPKYLIHRSFLISWLQ